MLTKLNYDVDLPKSIDFAMLYIKVLRLCVFLNPEVLKKNLDLP
jgi:hypothetical protein